MLTTLVGIFFFSALIRVNFAAGSWFRKPRLASAVEKPMEMKG
jgi:hypothetical protein